MPRIAIAQCTKLPDYEESVRRAGGDVRVLDRGTDRPADVIAGVDGVLLTGGGDVQPSIYGATPHPMFDPAEPGRDEYEMELVRRAIEANLPLFAICRGIQVLNVALGGSLYQDVGTEPGTPLTHSQKEPRDQPTHKVKVAPGSQLAEVMGAEEVDVNTMHHQALKALGRGLVATAWAPDQLVEGVEMPEQPSFVLGVQWHPEELIGHSDAARRLFAALVTHARR